MSRVATAPRAAKHARNEWNRLCAPSVQPPRFDVTMLDGLPAPARRWLTRAIKPGTRCGARRS